MTHCFPNITVVVVDVMWAKISKVLYVRNLKKKTNQTKLPYYMCVYNIIMYVLLRKIERPALLV